LKRLREPIKERAVHRILGKHDLIRPKYLRKYAFDKMIELDVPESVADFGEGRVPVSVGARHYVALARQSAKFCPNT
jgi:intergrase/recombinase